MNTKTSIINLCEARKKREELLASQQPSADDVFTVTLSSGATLEVSHDYDVCTLTNPDGTAFIKNEYLDSTAQIIILELMCTIRQLEIDVIEREIQAEKDKNDLTS